MSEDNLYYWKGKYDELYSRFNGEFREQIKHWKIAFGWTLASLIIGFIILAIVVASK